MKKQDKVLKNRIKECFSDFRSGIPFKNTSAFYFTEILYLISGFVQSLMGKEIREKREGKLFRKLCFVWYIEAGILRK